MFGTREGWEFIHMWMSGTGKSLSMEKVKQYVVDWARDEGLQPPDLLVINCTSLTSTSEIFGKIADKHQQKKKTSPLQYLQEIYSQKQQSSGSKMMYGPHLVMLN
ncbi:hypothetical protein SLE2022_351140 [Rubroshorea leprosula]